jgi:hypothetical protein
MKNVGIFYGRLVYLLYDYLVKYIGTICCHLVYFSRFGLFGPMKIWQSCNIPT